MCKNKKLLVVGLLLTVASVGLGGPPSFSHTQSPDPTPPYVTWFLWDPVFQLFGLHDWSIGADVGQTVTPTGTPQDAEFEQSGSGEVSETTTGPDGAAGQSSSFQTITKSSISAGPGAFGTATGEIGVSLRQIQAF